MTGSTLIALQAVTVRFGATVALSSVDFSLHAGERVALVGANGSGKTTLLRVLHGRLAHEGRRFVAGDLRQAMVFQRPFLLRLSVWHNLMLALWLARVPAIERAPRAHAALARVGLSNERHRPARVLSGGQQQRLALARAWAVRPQVLFLDEPTASLDPAAKREVEQLITEFSAEGMALVMSTHNLGQAKRLATRMLYLEGGHLVVDRPTVDFFEQPLPEPAALFLKGELPWSA
ncbi:MAG TPA: ATP-binding cassette domain-containing protein [Burkholderiaceae bacterium]|nr:ATP-binding cassette domain-containing protein [Burkholderiaceae bacterium]